MVAVVIVACGPAESEELLYVWMGDADGSDPDFLAVFDVDEDGATYGDVVGTVPLDLVESIPHHTEYEMPVGGGPLFLNAHWAERVVRVDYSDPARPRWEPCLRYRPFGFRTIWSSCPTATCSSDTSEATVRAPFHRIR